MIIKLRKYILYPNVFRLNTRGIRSNGGGTLHAVICFFVNCELTRRLFLRVILGTFAVDFSTVIVSRHILNSANRRLLVFIYYLISVICLPSVLLTILPIYSEKRLSTTHFSGNITCFPTILMIWF